MVIKSYQYEPKAKHGCHTGNVSGDGRNENLNF